MLKWVTGAAVFIFAVWWWADSPVAAGENSAPEPVSVQQVVTPVKTPALAAPELVVKPAELAPEKTERVLEVQVQNAEAPAEPVNALEAQAGDDAAKSETLRDVNVSIASLELQALMLEKKGRTADAARMRDAKAALVDERAQLEADAGAR